MATHEVRVDHARSLAEQPETGHNRWHPDIPPVVTCDPGDEVVFQTRDAFDGQMGPEATLTYCRNHPEVAALVVCPRSGRGGIEIVTTGFAPDELLLAEGVQ